MGDERGLKRLAPSRFCPLSSLSVCRWGMSVPCWKEGCVKGPCTCWKQQPRYEAQIIKHGGDATSFLCKSCSWGLYCFVQLWRVAIEHQTLGLLDVSWVWHCGATLEPIFSSTSFSLGVQLGARKRFITIPLWVVWLCWIPWEKNRLEGSTLKKLPCIIKDLDSENCIVCLACLH